MIQTPASDDSNTDDNSRSRSERLPKPLVPYSDPRSIWNRTHKQILVLKVLLIIISTLVMIWIIQKPITPTTIRNANESDIASALMPVLAAAIGINLFIELLVSSVEQNYRTLVAYYGRGIRWLGHAETEIIAARQWQTDVMHRYNIELYKLNAIIEKAEESGGDPQSVYESAAARLKAVKDLSDLAETRISYAQDHLDSLIEYSSYRRFKWSVITYFSILLGLLVATASSLQVFAIMGIQLDNPKIDLVITGLLIGGLVYPVHQVIGNLWDILTKLAKR